MLVIFIAPSVALASWWNPISWFNNWSFKKVPITPQVQINTQQNSDNKINELQKQVEELKKQQPILNSKNIKAPETNNNEQVNNVTTQSSNTVKTEEQPKVETIIKKEESKLQNTVIENKPINYNSILDFSSMSSDDISRYVLSASKKTGVPSDLLLSVVKNNNPNKSTCYVKYSKANTLKESTIINKNDLSAFNTIAYNLGLDSDKIAVSCDGTIGFGFIPRTWISFSSLNNDNNKLLLNPWNPEDVVMEIALVLGSNGGSYHKNLLTGEFNQTLACKNTTWCK